MPDASASWGTATSSDFEWVNDDSGSRRSYYTRHTTLCIILHRDGTEAVQYADGTISGFSPIGRELIAFVQRGTDIPDSLDWDNPSITPYEAVRYYYRDVYDNIYVHGTHDVKDENGRIIAPAQLVGYLVEEYNRRENKRIANKVAPAVHHHVCTRCKRVSRCPIISSCIYRSSIKVPCKECKLKFTPKVKTKKLKLNIGDNDILRAYFGHSPVLPQPTAPAPLVYDEYTSALNRWSTILGESNNATLTAIPVTQDNQGDTAAHEVRNETVATQRPSSDGSARVYGTSMLSWLHGDTVAEV